MPLSQKQIPLEVPEAENMKALSLCRDQRRKFTSRCFFWKKKIFFSVDMVALNLYLSYTGFLDGLELNP